MGARTKDYCISVGFRNLTTPFSDSRGPPEPRFHPRNKLTVLPKSHPELGALPSGMSISALVQTKPLRRTIDFEKRHMIKIGNIPEIFSGNYHPKTFKSNKLTWSRTDPPLAVRIRGRAHAARCPVTNPSPPRPLPPHAWDCFLDRNLHKMNSRRFDFVTLPTRLARRPTLVVGSSGQRPPARPPNCGRHCHGHRQPVVSPLGTPTILKRFANQNTAYQSFPSALASPHPPPGPEEWQVLPAFQRT